MERPVESVINLKIAFELDLTFSTGKAGGTNRADPKPTKSDSFLERLQKFARICDDVSKIQKLLTSFAIFVSVLVALLFIN